MTAAAPTPAAPRRTMSAVGSSTSPDPALQAAEAVRGDAQRQQQGGEGERVDVDRPGQLGLRGAGGAGELRRGQRQRRAGTDDQRQRGTHDGEQGAETAPDSGGIRHAGLQTIA
jgi:hypothetical protein